MNAPDPIRYAKPPTTTIAGPRPTSTTIGHAYRVTRNTFISESRSQSNSLVQHYNHRNVTQLVLQCENKPFLVLDERAHARDNTGFEAVNEN